LTSEQLRGYILEEIILWLLRASGYRPVEAAGLGVRLRRSGLWVQGRGTEHQADALGDFSVPAPFSHPPRLIVEGKSVKLIRIPVVRNAAGVLKDINEWFVPARDSHQVRRRHHYNYAVFTTGRFTKGALDYAFAQDIFAFSLSENVFMRGIVTALQAVEVSDFAAEPDFQRPGFVARVRRTLRERLSERPLDVGRMPPGWETIDLLADIASRIGGALMARANRHLPLLLVPHSEAVLDGLWNVNTAMEVRMFYDEHAWYLTRNDDTQERLFSFDLPKEVFRAYSSAGLLAPERALEAKRRELHTITALLVRDERLVKPLEFRLNPGWLRDAARILGRGDANR
jgi:hypothetical protein